MADTATTTYSFTLIENGTSDATWGTKTNANWVSIDTILAGISTVANAAVPKAGGTMTGALAHAVGSVSLPSVTFAGDLNTGLYWVSDGVIGVAINAVQAGTFTANGWTGDTSPAATPSTTATGYLGRPGVTLTANLTLAMSHAGKTIRHNGQGAWVVTVPPNSSVPYPIDTVIYLDGGGPNSPSTPFTVTTGSGVTFHYNGGTTTPQTRTLTVDASGFIQKISTDGWRFIGHFGVS